MKKRILALLTGVALLFSLAACGGSGDSGAPNDTGNNTTEAATDEGGSDTTEPTATGDEVVIKFANYALLEEGYTEFWEGVKSDFEAQNPGIVVEYVTAPYGEMVSQVINMAGGGEIVDLIFGELDWIPTLEDAGLAADAASILDADFLGDFYDYALDACKIDGTLYGLPMYVSPFLVYYNTDILAEAGYDAPPTTYDEMLGMAAAISELTTDDGNKIYAYGQTTASVSVSGAALTSMAYNFGGHVVNSNGELDAGNQGFSDMAAMLKTLGGGGYNPENAKLKDLRNLFALGQLAMYVDQAWGFNGVSAINPDAASFTASTGALAGGSGSGQSILQAHTLVLVDNGAEQTQALATFVEYLVTTEVLESYLTNITPAYPARQSMEGVGNSVLDGAADSVSNTTAVPFVAAQTDLNLELTTLAQAVTISGTDVDDAIADFEAAAGVIVG